MAKTFLQRAREIAEERKKTEQPPPASDPFDIPTSANGSGVGYAETALVREIEAMRSAEEGTRNDTLNRCAFNLGQLVAGGELDERYVVDELTEAAREIGLHEREIGPTLRSGLSSGMQEPRTAPPRGDEPRHEPASSPNDGDWLEPEPFTRELPEFPLDVFGWFAPHARAIADYYQVSPDLVGMLTLAVTAAAVRGRVRVQVDEVWSQPLNLYVAVVLDPGEMKSPVLNFLTAPLREIEHELIAEAEPRIRDAKQQQRIAEKRLTRMEKQASEDKVDPKEAAEAARELDEIEVPPEPQLLVDDMTPEALVRVLDEQDGVVAALSAEGGLFATMLGRYARGVANLDAILKAYDTETIVVNRKKDTTIRIPAPRLTLGLAVQPAVLRDAMENRAATGLGLMDRFAYAVPRSMVGFRTFGDRDTTSARVTELAREAVRELVRRGFGTFGTNSPNKGDSLSLSLSLTLVQPLLHRYFNEWEAKSAKTSDLGAISGWASKQRGRLVRIAGLLYLIRGAHAGQPPTDPNIDEDTFHAACRVSDFLAPHALAAFGIAGASADPNRAAQQLLAWIEQKQPPTFTARDAYRALHGRTLFKRAADMKGACDELVERGYLRQFDEKASRKGGRPTLAYVVYPGLLHRPGGEPPQAPEPNPPHDREEPHGDPAAEPDAAPEEPPAPDTAPDDGGMVPPPRNVRSPVQSNGTAQGGDQSRRPTRQSTRTARGSREDQADLFGMPGHGADPAAVGQKPLRSTTVTTNVAGRVLPIHFIGPDGDPTPALELVRTAEAVGFDTEAKADGVSTAAQAREEATDPYRPAFCLRTVQISDEQQAYVLDVATHRETCREILETARRLVVHDARMEVPVAAATLGVDIEALGAKTIDTRLLSQLLDPDGDHGLKELIRARVDPAYDGEAAAVQRTKELGLKGFPASVLPLDDPAFLVYAGLDAYYTLLLASLADELDPELVVREHRVAAIAHGMRHRGMLLDTQAVEELRGSCRAETADLNEQASRWNLTSVGIKSKEDKIHVAAWLKERKIRLERTPTARSDGKKFDSASGTGVAFDKDSLDTYRAALGDKDPELARLLEVAARWRLLDMIDRTYLAGYLRLADERGYLHPKINTIEARTGRMSCARPNLQNVPRMGGVRECFIAEEGRTFISVDYGQIEPRVLAAYCEDEVMLDAVRAGDIYAALAAAVFGEEQREAQRPLIKVALLAWGYIGTPAGIAAQSGLPVAEVEEACKRFEETFTGLVEFRKRLKTNTDVIHLPSGRTAMPRFTKPGVTTAINTRVQGTARDIFAEALIRLDDAGLGRYLRVPIHDETLAVAPVEEAEDVASRIAEVMTAEFRGVPIPAEAEVIGPRWRKT